MENSNFFKELLAFNWNILPSVSHVIHFDDLANGRMKYAPNEIKTFISSYQICTNKEDNIWFLSYDNYEKDNDSTFSWNEFENQSNEANKYLNDLNLKNKIDDFWNNHLTFFISVKNVYLYIAVGISNKNKGKIYYGCEPEYEEVSLIANSFSEFKTRYIQALKQDYWSVEYELLGKLHNNIN